MMSQMELFRVLILTLMKVDYACYSCSLIQTIILQKRKEYYSITCKAHPTSSTSFTTEFKKYLTNIIYPPMAQEGSSVSDQEFKEFINAIRSGNIEAVENVLKKNPSDIVNRLDSEIAQPSLHFAVLAEGDERSEQLIKLLIRHGANIRFKDNVDQTVLFYACRDGKAKCVEVLLSQGMSLDDPDVYGQTPMFYAVSENRLQIVKKYATKQRVNYVDKLAAQTPLYYAAKRGHLQMAKLLVEKGAQVYHTDNSNKTPADIARKGKQTAVADFLAAQLRRYRENNKLSMASQSVEESALERKKKKEEPLKPIRQTYKIVTLNEKGEAHDLTEEEVRQMVKSRPELETYLSNPDLIPQELVDKSNEDHWEKVAIKILAQCFKLKGSYWFQEPVDPVKFNILDYFEVISNPMDLGTVRKKISHNCYHSAKEFVDDMNLIWINCYKYNGDGHDISKCAKELESNFKEYSSSYGLAKYMEEENS